MANPHKITSAIQCDFTIDSVGYCHSDSELN